MITCPVCGTQCADDAAFCGTCGANISVVTAGASWSAPAQPPQSAVQPSDTWTPPPAPPQPAPQSAPQPSGGQFSGLFVDPDETVQASIGSGYLQSFLASGRVSKGIGVLTQKRFYFKGKTFGLQRGSGLFSLSEEGVVSLEDITFTRFVHARPLFLIVLGVLVLLADLVYTFIFNTYFTTYGPIPEQVIYTIILPGVVLALIFFLLYFLLRKHRFQVCFPGGCFTFNARWYPDEEIRTFQRTLQQLKQQNRSQYKP